MTWRLRVGVGVVALTMLGCAHRSGRASSPQPPPPATVEPLSMALVGRGEGAMVPRDSLDRLFEAPEVTAAGERLLGRLGGDPALQGHYSAFMADLMEQPALMEAFAAVAAREPSRSIEQLTEQIVVRLSQGIDGPDFDAALDASLDRLLDRPDVDAAFGRLAEVVVERARLVPRLTALLQQWQPELEAAVGVPMDDEHFAERLEVHVQQPERARRLRALMVARVVSDDRLRQGLVAVIEDEAFFSACARLVTRVLDDPSFKPAVTKVFAGMIEQVDAAELSRRVDHALVTPATEQAVVAWVDEVVASEGLATFAGQLGAVLDDPHLEAELFDVLVGASAGPTA